MSVAPIEWRTWASWATGAPVRNRTRKRLEAAVTPGPVVRTPPVNRSARVDPAAPGEPDRSAPNASAHGTAEATIIVARTASSGETRRVGCMGDALPTVCRATLNSCGPYRAYLIAGPADRPPEDTTSSGGRRAAYEAGTSGWPLRNDLPDVIRAQHRREPQITVRTHSDSIWLASVRSRIFGNRARRRDLRDLTKVGEPQITVRPRGNPPRRTTGRQFIFGHNTRRRNLSDLPRPSVCEPKIAVGSYRDLTWPATFRQCVFGDYTGRRYLPDLAWPFLGEPQIAVRASCDRGRRAMCGECIFDDRTRCGYLPDLTRILIHEPQTFFFRTLRNPLRHTPARQCIFFEFCTGRRYFADFTETKFTVLGKPHVAVGACCNPARVTFYGERVFGDRARCRDLPDLARFLVREPQVRFFRTRRDPAWSTFGRQRVFVAFAGRFYLARGVGRGRYASTVTVFRRDFYDKRVFHVFFYWCIFRACRTGDFFASFGRVAPFPLVGVARGFVGPCAGSRGLGNPLVSHGR